MSQRRAQGVVEQLLQLAGAGGPAGEPEVEAVEYDWRVPHRFVPAELKRLSEFAVRAAEGISGGLGSLLRTELKLAPEPVQQQYAADLRRGLSEGSDYCIALGTEGGQSCGLIVLPLANALGWVERLLGGSAGGANADRELSTVELGLLSDIGGALAKALSAASGQAGRAGFKVTQAPCRGSADLPGEDTQEYCRLSFRADASPDDPQMSVVLLSDVLEGVARGGAGGPATRGADDIRKDLAGHLDRVTVSATARLGWSQVAMRDIVSLEPGDVLLIDKRIDEPLELLVQGNVVLSGFLARSSGKYALKVAPPGRHGAVAGGGGDRRARSA